MGSEFDEILAYIEGCGFPYSPGQRERIERALNVLDMIQDHAVLSVLQPPHGHADKKGLVSIDMELNEHQLATLQAFLGDKNA